MDHFSVIASLVGAIVLLIGMVSAPLARSPLPPTLLALLLGVLVGPAALGLVDLHALGDEVKIRELATRLTLGIGLIGVALRVPRDYPRRRWRDVLVLVGPAMLVAWGVGTALVWALLGLEPWLAALVGAIIAATDPVAATPIVTGETAERNLPARLRHLLSLESGANDGLSYLIVFLPYLVLAHPPGEAIGKWLGETLLWDVGAATVLGLLLGAAAGWLLRQAERRDLITSHWRLVYTVALGLVAVGAGRLIGSDELLVVFAAGAAFVQVVSSSEREEEDRGQEAVNRFFAIPIFLLFGAAIPWEGWHALGWPGVALAALVLLLRRPPALLLLRPALRDVHSAREALFLGWFGPVAVAAIYYASLMEHKLHEPVIWHVTSLVVCASVVAHGATGAPLTRWLGRDPALRAEARRDEARKEAEERDDR